MEIRPSKLPPRNECGGPKMYNLDLVTDFLICGSCVSSLFRTTAKKQKFFRHLPANENKSQVVKVRPSALEDTSHFPSARCDKKSCQGIFAHTANKNFYHPVFANSDATFGAPPPFWLKIIELLKIHFFFLFSLGFRQQKSINNSPIRNILHPLNFILINLK